MAMTVTVTVTVTIAMAMAMAMSAMIVLYTRLYQNLVQGQNCHTKLTMKKQRTENVQCEPNSTHNKHHLGVLNIYIKVSNQKDNSQRNCFPTNVAVTQIVQSTAGKY